MFLLLVRTSFGSVYERRLIRRITARGASDTSCDPYGARARARLPRGAMLAISGFQSTAPAARLACKLTKYQDTNVVHTTHKKGTLQKKWRSTHIAVVARW